MSRQVNTPGSLTAFGENSSESKTPEIQLQFQYNINTEIVDTITYGSATATQEDNALVLSTNAAINSFVYFYSIDTVKYNPGQGTVVMFTALFSMGVDGSSQYYGIGNSADGFFFGYYNALFGILKRRGGEFEIRELVISAGASGTGNISITLNGSSSTVAVTSGDTIKQVVDKIVATSFLTNDGGWKAHRKDNTTITFIAVNAGIRAGAFSFSGGSTGVASSSFTSKVTGINPVDEFFSQSSWNRDKMGGPEHSRINMTLDPTKGNVYRIQYQWLGFGIIKFYIEEPSSGEFHLVHVIEYANNNIITSIKNPSLPIFASVTNTTNNTNIVLKTSSAAAFSEGKKIAGKIYNSANNLKAVTSELAILSVRNKIVYSNESNRIHVNPNILTISTNGNKAVLVKLYRNINIAGNTSFADINTSNSVMSYDTAGTTVSGGTPIFTFYIAPLGTFIYDLAKLGWKLHPGDCFTFTASSQTSNDVGIAINWREIF